MPVSMGSGWIGSRPVLVGADNRSVLYPHSHGQLDWSDLAALVRRYRDPGVELPVGDCGRIHLGDKRTAIRVERRKYLAGRVCVRAGCVTRGTAVFRKTRGYAVTLPGEMPRATREVALASARLTRFGEALRKLIEDGGRRAQDAVRGWGFDGVDEAQLTQALRQSDHWGCRCSEYVGLMETGRTRELLSFGDNEIRAVLECRPGGQAVGNNLGFLLYHVLHVYLRTNLIVAFGLEGKPEDWGSMTPGSSFRGEVMQDCDGMTFLPGARRFLADDLYVVDGHATGQLVDACFSFLVHYEVLCRVVGREVDWAARIPPELGLY